VRRPERRWQDHGQGAAAQPLLSGGEQPQFDPVATALRKSSFAKHARYVYGPCNDRHFEFPVWPLSYPPNGDASNLADPYS